MELHQIRYFLDVCQERNFTRAAKLSRVSQPSLTNGIKTLELDLGGELFLRSAPVQLSELGEKVLPFLEAIEALAKETKRISASHLQRMPGDAFQYAAPALGGDAPAPIPAQNAFRVG